jgi:hypothetical protein
MLCTSLRVIEKEEEIDALKNFDRYLNYRDNIFQNVPFK